MSGKSMVSVTARYQVLDLIGEGGMGRVYRATDRLRGEIVALKQLTVHEKDLRFATLSFSKPDALRFAIAQEFRTLASLRHPHIISVLDYGFDEENQPFFTMEYLDHAESILQYAKRQGMIRRIELLVDVLEALAYLHRRGIVHRDLKPENIMVVQDQVKVLDFGVASSVETLRNQASDTVVGTLAYMAPELLSGKPASEASDLYALGTLAYEIFLGHHPFASEKLSDMLAKIISQDPALSDIDLDERVLSILSRLLHKNPLERYQSAGEIIAIYEQIMALPPRFDKLLADSFIQSARFIGRETELQTLWQAFQEAEQGMGSLWLIGGESGVGKSRLVDELRVQLLVKGAGVISTQALAEGGASYSVWREVLKHFCLYTPISLQEAAIIKALVPDLADLLEQPVPDAPELEPKASRERLFLTIEALFARQTHPCLIILEDLQWLDESLSLLKLLSRSIPSLPILLVGTYRSDERPNLSQELDFMSHISLDRLSDTEVAALSTAILGEDIGHKSELVEMLQRESEGNPYFIVEVMKALAEDAGRVEEIGKVTLPASLFIGGIAKLIQYRLAKLPEELRPILHFAALYGRQLDRSLLQFAFPEGDLDEFFYLGSEYAILEVKGNQWQFRHEKFREELSKGLTAEARKTLHQTIAESIEAVYAKDLSLQLSALSHHWREAGHRSKTIAYASLAGEQALKQFANREAMEHLQSALTLAADQADLDNPRLAVWHYQLAEAAFQLGLLAKSEEHCRLAVAKLGKAIPDHSLPFLAKTLRQLLSQVGYRTQLRQAKALDAERYKTVQLEFLIHRRFAEIGFLRSKTILTVNCILSSLDAAETLGNSPELSESYAGICLAAGLLGLHGLAQRYRHLALQTIRAMDAPGSEANVLMVTNLYAVGQGEWDSSMKDLEQAQTLFARLGNMERWGICHELLLRIASCLGHYDEVLERSAAILENARLRDDLIQQAWSFLNQAEVFIMRRERDLECQVLIDQALECLAKSDEEGSRIKAYQLRAQSFWQAGNQKDALYFAEQALRVIQTSDPTSFGLLPQLAGVTELYLSFLGSTTGEKKSLKELVKKAQFALGAYAKRFAVGKPYHLLYQGWALCLDSKPNQGIQLLEKALETAKHLSMPYETAKAHALLARFLPEVRAAEATIHDNEAKQFFQQHGSWTF
jgi:predicted Ser/Thr protein kinase/tetratricopeptide (TPR) repeat protein